MRPSQICQSRPAAIVSDAQESERDIRTMTPPMVVPWPPIHFVADWTNEREKLASEVCMMTWSLRTDDIRTMLDGANEIP